MHTPWGTAQSIRHYGEGITEYTTASHGGMHVSEELVQMMPERFRTTWAGAGWYEEDCDTCMVIVSFPDRFLPAVVAIAQAYIDREPAYYGADGSTTITGPKI